MPFFQEERGRKNRMRRSEQLLVSFTDVHGAYREHELSGDAAGLLYRLAEAGQKGVGEEHFPKGRLGELVGLLSSKYLIDIEQVPQGFGGVFADASPRYIVRTDINLISRITIEREERADA